MELSEHKQKSGKVVSFGPQCMKTPENLFEGAEDASCREASLLAMQCPSNKISKLNYSMSGVLTSWGPFLKSHDCEYILVVVDYVSKWVEALPCRAADAKHGRKMFHEIVFPRFGTPRMVISDGGSHFINKTFRRFLKELGARHNIATPYHPQTSG